MKIEYPICPRCKKQTVAGACMTSTDPPTRSLYCTSGSCDYEVMFDDLTTPILPDGESSKKIEKLTTEQYVNRYTSDETVHLGNIIVDICIKINEIIDWIK